VKRSSRPASPPRAKSSSRAAGARAERRVRWAYRLRGYRVLDENAWAGGYELDLVLRRGRTIVFCEVKAKSGAGRGDPLEMVTEEKVRRLRRAGEAWLAAHREHAGCAVRFDVAAEREGRAERVANAF
jgi:putative endonuclease